MYIHLLSNFRIRELKAIFNEFDADGSGFIDMEEAKEAMSSTLSLTEEEVENLIRGFDENGDGQLDYEEFVKLWNSA